MSDLNLPPATLVRKPVSESRLVVVGAIRDGADSVQSSVRGIHRATQLFKEVQFFAVESDSSDTTIDVLEQLKAEIPNFRYIGMGTLAPAMPKRTHRLEVCRTRCQDEVRDNDAYAAADYVAVADLDGWNRSLTQEGIQSCWDSEIDWDVVATNQHGMYNDIWALRHSAWCPNDCWKEYWQLVPIFGPTIALRMAVRRRMHAPDPTASWIEVESAFGGFAIYKRDAYLSGRYVGLDETGEEICEHVTFHGDLRNRGCRIFINPALINGRYPEETVRQFLGPVW